MKKALNGLLILALVLLVAGCANGASETDEEAPRSEEQADTQVEGSDYGVLVEVSPESMKAPETEEDVRIVYTVTNTGAAPDVYALEFTDDFNVLQADIPATVSLEPGAMAQYPLSFTVMGGGVVSSSWDLRLSAVSQGDSTVAGEATFSITSSE